MTVLCIHWRLVYHVFQSHCHVQSAKTGLPLRAGLIHALQMHLQSTLREVQWYRAVNMTKRSKHTAEWSLVSTGDCQRYYCILQCRNGNSKSELCVYIHCSHTGSLSGEDEYRLGYKFLLKMVLSRCSDKAPRYGYLGVSTAISLVRTRYLKWASGLYQLSHCLQNCEGRRISG